MGSSLSHCGSFYVFTVTGSQLTKLSYLHLRCQPSLMIVSLRHRQLILQLTFS